MSPPTHEEVVSALEARAEERGEPLADVVRHHLLVSLVARVARAPEGQSFVLRGGLLTRAWVEPLPRPTRDLDYVGDFSFDVDDAARRFVPALRDAADDGVVFDVQSFAAKGIWTDTAFPGVRFTLEGGLGGAAHEPITVDVGFNDPLVPDPTSIELGGQRVRCVRPETQVAWKLHSLAEMGASFRPKDLADLWRITSRVALDDAVLVPAIVAAFQSRGYSRESARDVLSLPHWETKTARVRWSPSRSGAGLPPMPRVLDDVRSRLSHALAALS